jgi:hypothetical protein
MVEASARMTLEQRNGHTLAKLLISAAVELLSESNPPSIDADLELRSSCKCGDLCRKLTILSEPSESIRHLGVTGNLSLSS